MTNENHIQARAAIRTRFHGPTNTRGARISAYREGWSDIPSEKVYVHYEYGMNADENHHAAAQTFLDKFNKGNVASKRPLCFDGDYFWTWLHNEKEANAEND
tara:strand:- start:7 stop:312 length:306 start_codon:yes stop_codon:yes gene_type:complete